MIARFDKSGNIVFVDPQLYDSDLRYIKDSKGNVIAVACVDRSDKIRFIQDYNSDNVCALCCDKDQGLGWIQIVVGVVATALSIPEVQDLIFGAPKSEWQEMSSDEKDEFTDYALNRAFTEYEQYQTTPSGVFWSIMGAIAQNHPNYEDWLQDNQWFNNRMKKKEEEYNVRFFTGKPIRMSNPGLNFSSITPSSLLSVQNIGTIGSALIIGALVGLFFQTIQYRRNGED